MGKIKSQLRYGWPESRALASQSSASRSRRGKLAEATLTELTRLGVTVAIDDEGRARFRTTKVLPPVAKRLIETHGDLLESFIKEGQGGEFNEAR